MTPISRQTLLTRNTRQILAFLIVGLTASAIVVVIAARQAALSGRATLEQRAVSTLDIQSQALLNQLEKYRHVPALIARRNDIVELTDAPPGEPQTEALRAIAVEIAGLSGAVDVAFFAPTGIQIASASGFLNADIATGSGLIASATERRLGRASVSGPGGRRAYAFSSGVFRDNRLLAVLAVAAPLESIEQTWALTAVPVFATNSAGQMTVGNSLARELQGDLRVQLARDGVVMHDQFFAFSRPIPLLGWRLHVLEPRAEIVPSVNYAILLAAVSSALALLAGLAAMARLQGARAARRRTVAQGLRLERQVRDRTSALTESNRKLQAAQAELVRSAKLAGIGQMSAALAHEYNQPLAAIGSYAENARRFLEKGNAKTATENLTRIGDLVARMGELTRTLKSFARRPRTELQPTSVANAMRDAALLVQPKASQSAIAINVRYPEPDIIVRGGPVRLSQVFVNLLANAIDATVETGNLAGANAVEFFCEDAGDSIAIVVEDCGAGIAPEAISTIFDPFVTTKEVGAGLGLGLSIAFNIVQEFGGTLEAANRLDGGARFRVVLPVLKDQHPVRAQTGKQGHEITA